MPWERSFDITIKPRPAGFSDLERNTIDIAHGAFFAHWASKGLWLYLLRLLRSHATSDGPFAVLLGSHQPFLGVRLSPVLLTLATPINGPLEETHSRQKITVISLVLVAGTLISFYRVEPKDPMFYRIPHIKSRVKPEPEYHSYCADLSPST